MMHLLKLLKYHAESHGGFKDSTRRKVVQSGVGWFDLMEGYHDHINSSAMPAPTFLKVISCDRCHASTRPMQPSLTTLAIHCSCLIPGVYGGRLLMHDQGLMFHQGLSTCEAAALVHRERKGQQQQLPIQGDEPSSTLHRSLGETSPIRTLGMWRLCQELSTCVSTTSLRQT